jgi:hypothetical protein
MLLAEGAATITSDDTFLSGNKASDVLFRFLSLSLLHPHLQTYITMIHHVSPRPSISFPSASSHPTRPQHNDKDKDTTKQTASSAPHPSSHRSLYQQQFNHATPLLQNPHEGCETRVPGVLRLSSAKALCPYACLLLGVCVKGAVVEAGWLIKI